MDQDFCCLICRENEGEFLTRCNHRYHLECLSSWLEKQKEKCPLCRGPISQIQLLEDVISHRPTYAPLFKANSLELIDRRAVEWALKYKNITILIELLQNGIDLVLPAYRLKQLDFIRDVIDKEIANTSDSLYECNQLKKQLKMVNYVLKQGPYDFRTTDPLLENIRDESLDSDSNNNTYFSEKYFGRHFLHFVADSAAINGHLDIVRYFSDLGFSSSNTIITAIRGGHLEIVKYLTRNGIFNQAHPICRLFVSESIVFGHVDIMQYFVERGFNCDRGIGIAIEKGDFEMVKYLTKMGQYCSDDAIDSAASKEHLEILRYLIEKSNNKCSLDTVENAAIRGRKEIVKCLIQLGKPYSDAALKIGYRSRRLEIVKCVIENDGYDCSSEALDYAAEYGYLEIVQYLVEKGKPCTSNAIESAARNGSYEIVKCLIENGKECTTQALDIAASRGFFKIVKLLVEAGIHCSENAIISAVRDMNFEMVQYLVEKGEPCSGDVVAEAACYGNFEMVKLLVEAGKPCSEDVIYKANQAGRLEIIEYLLEKGEPCTDDVYYVAARNGSIEIIKCFLEHDVPCSSDAIDSAAFAGNFEIVQLLIGNRKQFTIDAIEGAVRLRSNELIRLLMKNEDLLINI